LLPCLQNPEHDYLERDFLCAVGSFSESTQSSKDLALKAVVFLSNQPLVGFLDFLFFSLSVHHFVFFLLGFGSPPALSRFLVGSSRVGKDFQLLLAIMSLKLSLLVNA
jgi:hypothetical protein